MSSRRSSTAVIIFILLMLNAYSQMNLYFTYHRELISGARGDSCTDRQTSERWLGSAGQIDARCIPKGYPSVWDYWSGQPLKVSNSCIYSRKIIFHLALNPRSLSIVFLQQMIAILGVTNGSSNQRSMERSKEGTASDNK